MPTSKRPRKRYRPKPVRYTCFDPVVVERLLADLTATEFGAYLSLQNGTATNDQMHCIRDCINLAAVLWCFRAKTLAQYGDGTELLNAASPAFVSLVERCRKLRGRGCNRYAGTAEELRAIQSAIAWCTDIIRDRAKAEYRFVQRIFINLCKKLSDPDSPPLIDLDRNTLMQLANYETRPKAA